MSGRKSTNQSFILRLWREDDEEDSGIWRGWIQHVGSGEEVFVQSLADFLAFVEQHFGALADANRFEDRGDQARYFNTDKRKLG